MPSWQTLAEMLALSVPAGLCLGLLVFVLEKFGGGE